MRDSERAAIEARALELGLIALIVQGERFSPLAFGDIARPVVVHSRRKSILSALYGEASGRGAIDPRRTLAQLAIDDDPKLTEAEKSATIFDLLAARSGVYLPAPGHEPTPGRPARGSHAPGTFWSYNNWDFNGRRSSLPESPDGAVGQGSLEIWSALSATRWVAADDNGVVPAGTFTAFGFGGNFLTVIPARETVVVSLVSTRSPSFKAVSGEAYYELLRIIVDALARTLSGRALWLE